MYLEMFLLRGTTAVVLGAGGGGHGTAISCALAEAGAHVIALDRDARELDRLTDQIRTAGGVVTGYQVDATDTAAIRSVFENIFQVHGGIDSLTNVIGGTRSDLWQGCIDYTDEAFDEVISTNLKIAFVSSREAARLMRRGGKGGSIVSLSSVSGLAAAPMHGLYGAAKSAILAMGKTMAIEWSAFGVRVNVLVLGSMTVPRLEYLRGDAVASAGEESIPLGHRGQPQDSATAALFLHSDAAKYITGTTLVVDGGLLAKTPFEATVVRHMGPSMAGAATRGQV